MALLLQELLVVAADLMVASVLSCLFSAAGCVVVPGLIGYVAVLSCGPGAVKNGQRSLSQLKRAVRSTWAGSCLAQTLRKMLAWAGLGGAAPPRPSEQPPAATWSRKPFPAGEKTCQEAVETLPGSPPAQTGLSSGRKRQPGVIWEEESEAPQRTGYGIPASLLALLFAPLEWGLRKRPVRKLAALLATLEKSRD